MGSAERLVTMGRAVRRTVTTSPSSPPNNMILLTNWPFHATSVSTTFMKILFVPNMSLHDARILQFTINWNIYDDKLRTFQFKSEVNRFLYNKHVPPLSSLLGSVITKISPYDGGVRVRSVCTPVHPMNVLRCD